LFYDFHTNPPDSLNKAYDKVRLAIEAEERETELNKEVKRRREDRQEEQRPKKRSRDGGRYEPRFHNYARLTAPQSEILAYVERRRRLPRPDTLTTPANKRDRSKYCDFHRTHGHTTNSCKQLRDIIEEMVRDGELREFLGRPHGRAEPAPRNEAPRGEAPPHQRAQEAPVMYIAGGLEPKRQDRKRKRSTTQVLHVAESSRSTETGRPSEPIQFRDDELVPGLTESDDALVVSMVMANREVRRIFIDTGASSDILFYDAFLRMGLTDDMLTPVNTSVHGLGGPDLIPLGTIDLLVTAGTEPKLKTVSVTFLVLSMPSAYNVIIGRGTIRRFQMVVSIPHLKAKFKTPHGIGEVRGNLEDARRSYRDTRRRKEALPVDTLDAREENGESAGPAEPTLPEAVDPQDEKKVIQVGSGLLPEELEKMATCLQQNADLFAWKPADMPGLDPTLICHELNVDPSFRPVKQKKRSFAPERSRAIKVELDKLLAAGFIREVRYPEWLANVVLVKKPSGKWRMCIDFSDLNDACPKDSYPLP
jgi:hypothetical protein